MSDGLRLGDERHRAALSAMRTVMDPEVGRDVVSMGLLRHLEFDGDRLHVIITMTSPACPLGDVIRRDAEEALRRALPEAEVRVDVVPPGRTIPPIGVLDGDEASRPRSSAPPRWVRVLVLLPGAVALLLGVWGGLTRAGWPTAPPRPSAVVLHGPLMVTGFLGTLIGLERAVAVKRSWAWLAPIGTGVGALLVLGGLTTAGPWVSLAASGVFAAVTLVLYSNAPGVATGVMAAGAAAWLAGNGAWAAGAPIAHAVPGWIGFLVLTIAGERVEMGDLGGRLGGRTYVMGSIAALVLAGAISGAFGSPPSPLDPARVLLAVGLLSTAGWLAGRDIARETIHRPGLPRYIATCLLSGYFWLAAGALLFFVGDPGAGGLRYDAAVHSVLLGFVFAMVFGHAPVVAPAVFSIRLPFSRVFYGPLAILQVAVALRIAGALGQSADLRRWGATLAAVAIGLFAASVLGSLALGGRGATSEGAE